RRLSKFPGDVAERRDEHENSSANPKPGKASQAQFVDNAVKLQQPCHRQHEQDDDEHEVRKRLMPGEKRPQQNRPEDDKTGEPPEKNLPLRGRRLRWAGRWRCWHLTRQLGKNGQKAMAQRPSFPVPTPIMTVIGPSVAIGLNYRAAPNQ